MKDQRNRDKDKKEKNMYEKRMVHKQFSVFDIMNYRSIVLPYRSSIRVLFEYDAVKKRENFKILSKDIPEETGNLLIAMLKENITSDKIIYGLDSNNLDYADIISKRIWMSNMNQDQGLINDRELTGDGAVPEKLSIN